MSTYKNCQKHVNNSANLEMDSRENAAGEACLLSSNASPPDFDFNVPCRFFKSSFARSLSLNAYSSGFNSQCKSLDYDVRSSNNNNSNINGNKLSCFKIDMTAVPPLPQRRLTQAGSFYQQNEANKTSEQKQVFADIAAAKAVFSAEEKPPALPARRPLSLNNLTLPQNLSVNECQMNMEQKFQQNVLTQLRQHNGNDNNSNNNINCGYNKTNYADHDTGLHLSPQEHQQALKKIPQRHHFAASSNNSASSSGTNSWNSVSNNGSMDNFRRNNNNNNLTAWPNQQKTVEQDYNVCAFDQVAEDVGTDELNSNYHDASKLSTSNYNNHFHNSHQMLHALPTINVHSNQQQQQTSSYEILNENSTNVEALILQNQVDTLQWQLKQVETGRDMYRAVMEEVARFLERYQTQKKEQLLMAAHKHCNNNNNNNNSHHNNSKLEQIPRSKSLFQVYTPGGHEKCASGSNDLNEATLKPTKSTSYLRARSSTNLVDLKQQSTTANCSGKTKSDHIFEPDLTSSQTYSAFNDFTWRRSPKKCDSRLSLAKDDVEEKLNQDAFRLLRTIQNLLNTSHHQPDLTHYRHSLAPTADLPVGRLSKAMSTASVVTLPAPPNTNSNGTATNGSSNSTPTTTLPATVNNAASTNLAPEMLFLRSANMRDSRLSLRSTTDSSVHSTSSAASSASSKLETDEEPANTLTPKQHHHLTGSSTEDESGFSSISSFPDIGVPINSTLLSSTENTNGKGRLIGKELKSLKANESDSQPSSDSRYSTLKANIVGLPLNSSQDVSLRWDSTSKTYHNASNKFQKFSALPNEDSTSVLWV